MSLYQAGETVRLVATITNTAGTAVNPATVKISIKNPSADLVVDSIAMTTGVTGTYYYDYEIPAANTGTYRYNVIAVGAESRITIVKDSFSVNKAI